MDRPDRPRVDPHLLLTYRTYGTWLPGDARGARERGGVLSAPNGPLEAYARGVMTAPTMHLGRGARQVVLDALRETCAFRSWELRAAHVRPDHVHVVLRPDAPPERVIAVLKAWASRRLYESGVVARDRRVWARHGSAVWLNDVAELSSAIEYVVSRQGEPMAVWREETPSQTRST